MAGIGPINSKPTVPVSASDGELVKISDTSPSSALGKLQPPPPPPMRTAEEVERIAREILKSYRNYVP